MNEYSSKNYSTLLFCDVAKREEEMEKRNVEENHGPEDKRKTNIDQLLFVIFEKLPNDKSEHLEILQLTATSLHNSHAMHS